MVRRLRDSKQLTQTDLARLAGMDRAVISRIESGKAKQVWPRTVERLAAALGVATDEFFRLAGAETTPRPYEMTPLVRNILAMLMELDQNSQLVVLGTTRALHEVRRRGQNVT